MDEVELSPWQLQQISLALNSSADAMERFEQQGSDLTIQKLRIMADLFESGGRGRWFYLKNVSPDAVLAWDDYFEDLDPE
jgi:hypothetical protein